jgi:hypothetical protein
MCHICKEKKIKKKVYLQTCRSFKFTKSFHSFFYFTAKQFINILFNFHITEKKNNLPLTRYYDNVRLKGKQAEWITEQKTNKKYSWLIGGLLAYLAACCRLSGTRHRGKSGGSCPGTCCRRSQTAHFCGFQARELPGCSLWRRSPGQSPV